MEVATRFDDLADLALIEIFSYLSSFDILWGFSCLNQRISSLVIQRKYFSDVNLSSSSYYQFQRIIQIIPLNKIESLTIDINASPLQFSHWPYLPNLTKLKLKGVREFNDIIIFLLLHANTLTHLILDTRVEFTSVGYSLKFAHPVCYFKSLVKNIIFRKLHALRSLDLGTNEYNQFYNWRITNISTRLTFLRIVLRSPYDLIRLLLTRSLSNTLKYLHITLNDILCKYDFHSPRKDELIPMKQLHSFTLVKSFRWRLNNELTFIEVLTDTNIMPMLRRIKLSISLNNDELNRFKQCSIFNDYRCIDVHFVLCIHDRCENNQLKNLIPHGSLSHPRQVVGSVFTTNYWYDVGYSTTVPLTKTCRYNFDRQILWYTLPWSFEKFFQLASIGRCNHEREIYASPSLPNIIIPSNSISTINQQENNLPLFQLFSFGTTRRYINKSCHQFTDTNTRITIPSDRIIVIDCFNRLADYLYTENLRSIHILLFFSNTFSMNWNSLCTFSNLPLLKSLRITMYNFETILQNDQCQVIANRVPMLIDFVFCFRTYKRAYNKDNDPFNIHHKSISNLCHHISKVVFDQQPMIVIEADGCGLTIWL